MNRGRRHRAASRSKGTLALLLLAVAATGCAARQKPIALVWPEPPEAPRVKFVRALASEADLKSGTFAQSVTDFVIGRKREISRLDQPLGLAISDDGKRLYVSDYGQLLVYVFDFERNTVTLVGAGESLGRPLGVALDGVENLYVVDQDGKRVIVFDAQHTLQRQIKLEGITRPSGIAIDRSRGLMYVVDTSTKQVGDHLVKAYDLQGNFVRDVGKGKGNQDGYLFFPTYVTLDSAGNLYVSDTMNSRVCVFDPDGNFLRFYGGRGDRWGEMNTPKGVALDTLGNVYVVDSAWSVVQIYNQKRQVLLFFGGRNRYPGMFENPTAIAIDHNNRIYVADTFNFRVNVYDLVNATAEDAVDAQPPAGGGNGQPANGSANNVTAKASGKEEPIP